MVAHEIVDLRQGGMRDRDEVVNEGCKTGIEK